jgi:beta-glucosidase
MKRSPLCGRNFEYFSEDPYLAGKMAAGYIRGLQKNSLSACPKHFAVNNQELLRMSSNSILDERTLREIYLTGFEIAVKEGKPKSIMTSYNLINGKYANENEHLLKDILKKEWGFQGAVITDWGGSNDHTEGVRCGSTLEMPVAGGSSVRELIKSVRSGKLEESVLDDRVEELLELIYPAEKVIKNSPRKFSEKVHHELARKAAAESIVLLKNAENLLPLKKGISVALIGDFAKTPRYQGAGSSIVNPTSLDTLLECISESELNYAGYAAGYDRNGAEDNALLKEAVSVAQKAEVVLFCIGLDEMKESEGLDRKDMKISENQIRVLQAVADINPNIIGILSAGSAVEMPWLDSCRALIHGYLGGQAGAGAALDVILGKVCPSGKLSETYPLQYEDTPAYEYFPGKKSNSEYREGIYIGYRYYETVGQPVRFPFGYGLSYTTFEYSNLKLTDHQAAITLKNTGNQDCAEIVQMYVHKVKEQDEQNRLFRPEKELKGFQKVFLKAGETKEITIIFDDKTFRYFDVTAKKWVTEGGTWEIQIGKNCRDIMLSDTIEIKGKKSADPYQGLNLNSYQSGQIRNVLSKEFSSLLGSTIPEDKIKIDRNIAFGQLNHGRSPIGWIVWLVLTGLLKKSEKSGKPDLNLLFIYNMPLRALSKMTNGAVSMGMVDGLVMEMKGFWVIGLIRTIIEAIRNLAENIMLENYLKQKQEGKKV